MIYIHVYIYILGGGFRYFLFSPLFGGPIFFRWVVQPLTSIQYNDYAFSGEFCLQVRNPEKVIPRLKRNGIFDSHWFGLEVWSDEKGSLVV